MDQSAPKSAVNVVENNPLYELLLISASREVMEH